MTAHETSSEHAAPPSGAPLSVIDTLVFQLLPRGYAWPASALTGFDMQRLNEIKEATRRPVTQLLQEAVDLLYEATAKERAELTSRKATVRKRVRKTINTEPERRLEKRRVARSLFPESDVDASGPGEKTECHRTIASRSMLNSMADVVATSESPSDESD